MTAGLLLTVIEPGQRGSHHILIHYYSSPSPTAHNLSNAHHWLLNVKDDVRRIGIEDLGGAPVTVTVPVVAVLQVVRAKV